jgi:hypothetical protein
MDWLADDAFGVICVREVVDGMQEVEVRVAWDRGSLKAIYTWVGGGPLLIRRNVTGTKSDNLLIPYMENAADMTDQDILFLATHITNTTTTTNNPTETRKDNLTIDQAKQKINDWIESEQQGGRPKWFEIRMVVENAMKYSCGIWNIGPAAVLTEMKGQFDGDGVMRY